MGRLVIFGRAVNLAPDDLGLTSLFAVVCRLTWFILLIRVPMILVPLAAVERSSCDYSNSIGLFVIVTLFLNGLLLIVDSIGMKTAFSGTVKNAHPRRWMPLICHLVFGLLCVDFFVQIYGLVMTFNSKFVANTVDCLKDDSSLALNLIRIVNIWAFVVDSCYFLSVFGLLLGSSARNPIISDMNAYLKIWKRRIEWLIKSPTARNSEGQEVITKVSTILANYFKEVDWAPSDMAVGLILLKREQKLFRRLARMRNHVPDLNWTQFEAKAVVEYDDSEYESEGLSRSNSSRVNHLKLYSQNGLARKAMMKSRSMENLEKKQEIAINYNSFSQTTVDVRSGVGILLIDKATSTDFNTVDLEFMSSVRSFEIPRTKSESPLSVASSNDKDELNVIRLARSLSLKGKEDAFFDNNRLMANQRNSGDWKFGSYAFNLPKTASKIRNVDIQDVIHFMHYANMAYVELDNEVYKKLDILLHYSPLNDLFRAPYLVSLDHDWSSIVIAIRGSYSATDVLVDLKFETEILDHDLEYPELHRVHSGMLITAQNIVDDLIQHRVLEKIREDTSHRGFDYQIVVCGHSLGAGVAALVAYMLKKIFQGNDIRAYGYNMPPVANRKAASLFDDFVISVVVGDDAVSRVNIHSLELLREDVSRLLKQCDLPKYRIFSTALGYYFFNSDRKKTKNLLHRTQGGINVGGIQKVDLEKELRDISKVALSIPKQMRLGNQAHFIHTIRGTFPPMFIPGRILYLEKIRNNEKNMFESREKGNDKISKDFASLAKDKLRRGQASINRFIAATEKFMMMKHEPGDFKYSYIPRWADKEEFQEIIVSRSMILDHTLSFGIFKEFETFEPSQPLVASS